MKTEIKSLTGIRGIAALYVVFCHCHLFANATGHVRSFLDHGNLAVDLFFVLSGYVMAMTYGISFSNEVARSSYSNFMIKRFIRVYPLYFFLTIFAIIAYYLYPQLNTHNIDMSAGNIAAHLLLIQSWGISKSYVGPAWSISTELAAYLLFPLIVFWSQKGNVQAIILMVVGLIGVSYLAYFVDKQLPILNFADPVNKPWPVLKCLFEFTIGVSAFSLSRIDKFRTALQKNVVSVAIGGVMGLCLFIDRSDVVFVALCPLFLISIVNDNNLSAKLLSCRPIFFLGVISYSLYLIHLFAGWFQKPLQAYFETVGISAAFTLSSAITIPVSILLATATYYLIEHPCRIYLSKKFAARKRTNEVTF